MLCWQAPCEGLFTPFIYNCKWLQRSLSYCRAKKLLLLPCSPHLLHWERWSCTKMKLDHVESPTMHGMAAWHPSFLVAQPTPQVPWRSCPCSTAMMVSNVFPGIQGRREQVTRMLVATPAGHKKISRMQNSFSRCTPVPVSRLPHVSLCLVSAEALQKRFSNTVSYVLSRFFCIARNFQPARDYSSKMRQNPLFSLER